MNNSNLFYDNKRVHISPLFCTLIFAPNTFGVVGGGGGGDHVFQLSEFSQLFRV